MHRLNELAKQLTPQQVHELEAVAERMISLKRQAADPSPPATVERDGQQYVNVDALRGLLAGIDEHKSDKELVREAWDDVLKKYYD